MDEFELLVAILVGIYKLVRFFVRGIFRLLRGALRIVARAQGGEVARAREPSRFAPKKSASLPPAPPPAPPPAQVRKTVSPQVVKELDARLAALADEAESDLTRVEGEPPNLAFVETLAGIAKRAREAARTLRSAAASALAERAGQAAIAQAMADELESLLEIVKLLASQRRETDLYSLLAPTDALAAACYRPIVAFCGSRRIPLASDRTATVLDGDKLYLLRTDDPSGLAIIVLPGAFSTELGWWPAVAHEIGHDFYGSVRGLDAELRRRLALPIPRACTLPPTSRLSSVDLDRAVGAWQEELFADAFGTMMLGPAYVATMSWIFARPERPEEACAAARAGALFEEHPPGHVRVACGCRLLADMGYGAEADDLYAKWRARHREPDRVFIPTAAGSWSVLAEGPVIERAYAVAETLYRVGLDALLGVPLRSIPGLDFGPREHEEARRVAAALTSGRRLTTRDPRLTIAGAALAWLASPGRAAVIFRSARDAALRAAPQGTSDTPDLAPEPDVAPDAELLRDAIVLRAILEPRSSGSRARRGW